MATKKKKRKQQLPKNFTETLRRARLGMGLSQQEVAYKVGVSQPLVSMWERGEQKPNDAQHTELKRVLGIGAERTADDNEGAQTSAIGVWLNKTRVEKNFSVAELAVKAGVSIPAIYNIEAGRSMNPQKNTVSKLEKSLGQKVPQDVSDEAKEEATIEGVGELVNFDPYDKRELPKGPGVYVLYDISDRPIYVGEGAKISTRILDHEEKFWFKRPIVEAGSYLTVKEKSLRQKIEKALIKFMKSNAVINKQNVDRGE